MLAARDPRAVAASGATARCAQFPADHETRVGLRARRAGGRRRARAAPVQVVADFGGAARDQRAVAACTAARATASVATVGSRRSPRATADAAARRVDAAPRRRATPTLALVERLRGRRPAAPARTSTSAARPRQDQDFTRPDLRLDVEDPRCSCWRFSYLVLLVLLRSVAAAAEGGPDEPAVGRRRLRRAGRGLPVRLGRRRPRLRLTSATSTRSRRRCCSRSSSACRWTTRCSCSAGSASATTRPATTARAVAEGLAGEREDDLERRADHGRRLRVFALTGVPQVKEIGVGLRGRDRRSTRRSSGSSSCPATMELMGDWNWWLPPWLDRILPRPRLRGRRRAGAARRRRARRQVARPYAAGRPGRAGAASSAAGRCRARAPAPRRSPPAAASAG